MKKCCDCKKIVWPWAQSAISLSPIHKNCHQERISKLMAENPALKSRYAAEISDFERKVGVQSGIKI
jgi:hypothetical protein